MNDQLQEKSRLVSGVQNKIYQMNLLLLIHSFRIITIVTSQLTESFSTMQGNNGQHIRHTAQIEKSFTDKFGGLRSLMNLVQNFFQPHYSIVIMKTLSLY
jgi:hypothetical protein